MQAVYSCHTGNALLAIKVEIPISQNRLQ